MDIEFELATAMEFIFDDLIEQGEIKRLSTTDDRIDIVLELEGVKMHVIKYLQNDKIAVTI